MHKVITLHSSQVQQRELFDKPTSQGRGLAIRKYIYIVMKLNVFVEMVDVTYVLSSFVNCVIIEFYFLNNMLT